MKPTKNFLKRIREDSNLTQDQLAESSGVTRYIISEFENEKRRPSPRTINRLSEALGCSYIELMTGKDKSEKNRRSVSSKDRSKYLEKAIDLTQKDCSKKDLDTELLMKISGYLSYLIEEYDFGSEQEKAEIIKKAKEQRAELLANEIFIKNKPTNNKFL